MSEASINLLAQIPLAGVIVLVVVIFLKFMGRTDDNSRAFIREQREANNEAIIRLTDQIAIMNDCSMKHDQFVRISMEEIRRNTQRQDVEIDVKMRKSSE